VRGVVRDAGAGRRGEMAVPACGRAALGWSGPGLRL